MRWSRQACRCGKRGRYDGGRCGQLQVCGNGDTSRGSFGGAFVIEFGRDGDSTRPIVAALHRDGSSLKI